MWDCGRIVLLTLLFSTTRIVLASDSEGSDKNNSLSNVFENASKSISQYINVNFNPCDNFYKFSCGHFAKVNKKLDYGYSDGDVRQLDINTKLENFLTSTSESNIDKEFESRDSTVFILAKRFLLSCKDSESSEREGIQPLVKLIDKYGGWPVVKGVDWNETNWDWIKTIGQMAQDGFSTNAFLTVSTRSNDQDSPIYKLDILEPQFGYDKDLLLSNYKPYYDFMIYIAVEFGADEASARIQMAQVLHFERELAKNTNPMNEIMLNDDLLYIITLWDLQISHPYLDWLKYIRSVLPSDVKINKNEFVYFKPSDYFVRLRKLLKQTRKRTIANYLIWRTVLLSTEYLNKDLYDRREKFIAEFTETDQEESSRYDQCFTHTEAKMKMAINTVFNRLRSPQLTKPTDALVDDIKSEFMKMVQEVRWMDSETKKEAMEKAQNMTISVAEPNNTSFKTEIENYYDGLKLNASSYFENVLSVLKFEEFKKHRKLNQPVVDGPSERHLQNHLYAKEVNAFYQLSGVNSVYIPTASLDYFDAHGPYYLNYGAFGQTVGHEIAHGFDNSGHGELIGWSFDEKEFSIRAKCFIDQYTRLGINGTNTIDENIADNGGVKAAYRAYQKYVDGHGAEALLPDLEYTQQQLFWISVAQAHCSKDTKSTIKALIENDVHSPSPQRVNGMVQNMPEFARDFKCSPGSKMNPVRKCEIW